MRHVMRHYQRKLDLLSLLEKKAFFLLGPRATGKSTLIADELRDNALMFNLLKSNLTLRLSSAPWELEGMIEAALAQHNYAYIVIDEVHRLIEEKGYRFLLTGSSARKLKYGHANLLAGRAWTAHLYPLSYSEIPQFDLDHYLRYGGLPAVYSSQSPKEELFAYVQTYLYEM